jgi:hypothetical protein
MPRVCRAHLCPLGWEHEQHSNQLLVAQVGVEVLSVDAHAPVAWLDGLRPLSSNLALQPYAKINEVDYDTVTELRVLQAMNPVSYPGFERGEPKFSYVCSVCLNHTYDQQ